MEQEIKNQIELFTFTNSLPKLDLHVHLNGCIRKTTLLELLSKEDKKIIENCYNNLSPENIKIFLKTTSKLLEDLKNVKRIINEVIEDYSKHNVIYLELRASIYSKQNSYSKEEYLNTILEEINKSNNLNDNIITRLIISIDRDQPLTEYEEILQLYKNYKNLELKKLIVGIDSNSAKNCEKNIINYTELIPFFKKFRDEGLGITFHLDEYLQENKKFPFNEFTPDRVSNAFLYNTNECFEIIKRKIILEVCPSISLKMENAISMSDIYMKNFFKKTVINENNENFIYELICICSGCNLISFSDVSQEYFEIGMGFNLSIRDLKNFSNNTVDFIFEKNEKIKEILRNKINSFNV